MTWDISLEGMLGWLLGSSCSGGASSFLFFFLIGFNRM